MLRPLTLRPARASLTGLALAWLAVATATARAEDEGLVDGIAAQVGGDIVLVSEVMERVAAPEARLRKAGGSEVDVAKLRADGLESIIEARLIGKVVERAELYASDAEVDGAIEAIAQENGLTMEQLRSSVRSQGMAYEEYREQIKGELERQKVVGAMVSSRVRVDDAEILKLYKERFSDQPEGGDQFHIRQILVTFGEHNGRTVDEACDALRQAEQQIRAGVAFEQMASQISEVEPRRGGDIGWLHSDSLAGWMLVAVKDLGPGEISGVIELPFGCCALKVVERRSYTPVTFEMAKARLEQEVFATATQRELRAWLEELRSQTYIKRRGYFSDAAQFSSTVERLAKDSEEQSIRP